MTVKVAPNHEDAARANEHNLNSYCYNMNYSNSATVLYWICWLSLLSENEIQTKFNEFVFWECILLRIVDREMEETWHKMKQDHKKAVNA